MPFKKKLLEQSQWSLFIYQDIPILHLNHIANVILDAGLIFKNLFSDHCRTVQLTYPDCRGNFDTRFGNF